MKNLFNIKTFIFSLTTASLIFSGCGSNGIDDVYKKADDSGITDYTVQVVDEPVLGATILANECSGFEERTNGYYVLTGCDSRPKAIIASGGYMELDDENVSMGFPLMINTNMIKQSTSYTATPLTTLLATVNSYAELIEIKESLGFDSVQDMFVDDNNTRDLQRTLNSFYIEAQESGVDLNSFADFTADFRAMINQAGKEAGGGLATIKAAKTKMKEDFDANPSKYLNKYGVVFSGFVTSTNYKDQNNSKDLLKDIGQKFAGSSNSIVFSGFIYDDIIGSANSDKYAQDANISITNLNTNTVLTLINESNSTSEQANSYGQYTINVKASDIVENHSYLLEGTLVNKDGKVIKLNSILTGKEILSKFKSKLNSSDIPGMNITNVSTAKVAILEKKGSLTDVDNVIASKQELANSTLLLDISAGLKTIIDGDAATTGDTFTYIKSIISSNGTTFTPATDMNAQLEEFKTLVQQDKTLSTQLKQTTVYEEFNLTKEAIENKEIAFKLGSEKYKRKLLVFKDGSFTMTKQQADSSTVTVIGSWVISGSNLNLTSTQNESYVVSFTSLTQSKAEFDEVGNFKGVTEAPRGRITDNNSSELFKLVKINDIDLTAVKAPIIKFTSSVLNGKQLFLVYSTGNYEFEDMYYEFTDTEVKFNEDVTDGLDGIGATVPYSISNDGILSFSNHTYEIINSYQTKIVALRDGTEIVELYYAAIDAAAARDINNFSNPERFIDLFSSDYWGYDDDDNNNPGYNTRNDNPFGSLKAVPLNNDITNYEESKIGTYLKKSQVSHPTEVIGIKGTIKITDNNGDSGRQSAGINSQYYMPTCSDSSKLGQLRVNVVAKYNKIKYQIKRVDPDGNAVDLYDESVVIVEENTLNANYDIMILLVKNVVIIQVQNGANAYYSYVPLETLWKSKEEYLKEYKYPTQFKNSYTWASLYDDGTLKYKGKSNAPIEVELNSFNLVNGDEANSYEAEATPFCSAQ